jgi:hypothetical protein
MRSLATLLVVLAACGGAPPSAPAPAPASTAAPPLMPAPRASVTTTAAAVSALDTAVANVDALLKTPSREQVEKVFAPSFFAQVPEDRVMKILESLHSQGGECTRVGVDDRTEGSATARYKCAQGGGIDAQIVIAGVNDPKMTGLLLKPR